MADKAAQGFYITLYKKGRVITRYIVSSDPPTAEDETLTPAAPSQETDLPGASGTTFSDVLKTFISAVESYRNFITLTLTIAPFISSVLVTERMEKFLKAKGHEISAASNENKTTYELDLDCHREFCVHHDEVGALIEGSRHLPEVMIIGLLSCYDAFLARLLRLVLNKHPQIVLTSDKAIKFSELSSFSSIEEARSSLIDREIEGVIRFSHQEQFSWMEDRFSIQLRENLPIWPEFIELCERRNLRTHTGGVVSTQYLANCKAQKVDVTNIKTGTKLTVDNDYFARAVDIIYEIGVKLSHVLWRKFAKDERKEADKALNDLCYNLIYERGYGLAESLLSFGVNILKTHASDSARRIMIVNLANAIRLQNREQEAKAIVAKEDWSAVDYNFKICVAAVNGEVAEVVRLMPIIGPKSTPSAESYRTWPVFIGIRTNQDFIRTFESVFGESFIATESVDVSTESPGADSTDKVLH